jgi:hypothetical protein
MYPAVAGAMSQFAQTIYLADSLEFARSRRFPARSCATTFPPQQIGGQVIDAAIGLDDGAAENGGIRLDDRGRDADELSTIEAPDRPLAGRALSRALLAAGALFIPIVHVSRPRLERGA